MKILLTGASGFLGQNILRESCLRGHNVLIAGRDGSSNIHFELGQAITQTEDLDAIDVIIHAAWEMSASLKEKRRRNLEGVEHLLRLAKQSGAHFVFVSSLAANAHAQSDYGLLKRQAEALVQSFERSAIIRPGTVIGDGGLFGRIRKTLARARVAPLLYGGRQKIQLIPVKPLVQAIVKIAETSQLGTFNLATYPGIEAHALYRSIAKNVALLPLPGDLACALLAFTEKLHIPLPLSRDNILGLKYHCEVDTRADWYRLGLDPLPSNEAILLEVASEVKK